MIFYNNFIDTPFNDWQEIDVIVSRDCSLRCSYCMPQGTKIKTLQYDDINIEEIKKGDLLLGFDEYPKKYSHHKTESSIVMEVNKRISKVIKITTKNNEIFITKEHPILNSRGRSKFAWKEAGKYKIGDKIKVAPKIDFTPPNLSSIDYKTGYFLGIIMGDGSYKHYNYGGKNVYKIRIAMEDDEAINRTEMFSKDLGIIFYRKNFKISEKNNISKEALFANTKIVYEQVNNIINKNFMKNDSVDYAKGFLAGIYDAEGNISNRGTIRICNTNENIIDEIKKSLDIINIKYIVEDNGETINYPNKYNVRILSPRCTLEYIRFIKTVEPAIQRKSTKVLLNRNIFYSEKIISIEEYNEMEVYNIETSSSTFVANNICVHNCYLHKSPDHSYDIDTVINSVDKLLYECEESNKEGVILSFYPEPWVNIPRSNELIKRCLELLLKHPRYISNYMLMLGTNGALLNKQIPILKNLREHLSINVTLDGIKEQHDMYRVFPDGSPSWEIVKNNMLTYQNLYNINGTKVTLGPDTIKYIYESSLFLWDEMHLKDINMNVVYEDLWGDRLQECLIIFEEQLKLLYDDIIKNKRWEHEQYQGLLGSRHIPHHIIHEENQRNSPYCGAGVMRSIDSDGKIYPCFRFSPYALQENKTYALDNKEISRALKTINVMDSVSEKCRTCDILSICSVCIGGCVEEKSTLFGRTIHHCEFQKLQTKYALKLYEEINAIHSNN